jgi:hypothetical protein
MKSKKKLVGICSDGAGTMLGVHKGVCTQLAQAIRTARQHVIEDIMTRDRNRRLDSFHKDRGVFVVHCVCHRLALVLTDGIKGSTKCDAVIPDECVTLMNELYGYFAKSPKRKKALKDYLATENAATIERRKRLEDEGRRIPPALDEVNPVDALKEALTIGVDRALQAT